MKRFLWVVLIGCLAVCALSVRAQAPPSDPLMVLGYVSRGYSGGGQHFLESDLAHPDSVAVVFRAGATVETRSVVYRGSSVFQTHGPSGHYFGSPPTMLGYIVQLYPNPDAGEPMHRVNPSAPDSSNMDVEYNPGQWHFDRVELGTLVIREPGGVVIPLTRLYHQEMGFQEFSPGLLLGVGVVQNLRSEVTASTIRQMDFDDQAPPPPAATTVPAPAAGFVPGFFSIVPPSSAKSALGGPVTFRSTRLGVTIVGPRGNPVVHPLRGLVLVPTGIDNGFLRVDFEAKSTPAAPGPPVNFFGADSHRIDFEKKTTP